MTPSTLNKLLLSRTMFHMAKEHASASTGTRLSIACNLLQDSVESFMLALAEHVHAQLDQRTTFESYFDKINEKIKPDVLPFQPPLVALNKMRVASKHYGVVPAKSELDGKVVTVTEFFEQVSQARFGQAFSTISLVNLLSDGRAKEFLREAEHAFEHADFANCLISCRKAIYVTFESNFNAHVFTRPDPPNGLLALGMLGALHVPFYARSRQYLEEHVKDPTDYIILDHNELEMDLMKCGIDSASFWNVLRMTPAVFQEKHDSEWVIHNDFQILEEDGIKDRAEYVLATTTDILLAHTEYRRRARTVDPRRYYVDLKREGVPLYSKTSKSSLVVQTTPPGLTRLNCTACVQGLDGSGRFWKISHIDDELWLTGFAHEDDLEV